jgi:hypothetical protein
MTLRLNTQVTLNYRGELLIGVGDCSYLSSCRREALRTWKSRQGVGATYGNLLRLFETAEHAACAGAVCEVLRKK